MLRDNCAITSVPGQFWDGPRAYRYIEQHVLGADGTRTKEDKDFYDQALKMQQDAKTYIWRRFRYGPAEWLSRVSPSTEIRPLGPAHTKSKAARVSPPPLG